MPWIAVAWIVLILSGASTTGLLRAPISNAMAAPLAYQLHRYGGTILVVVGIIQLVGFDRRRRSRWIGAVLMAATAGLGWLCAWRSLSPALAALHALTASVAAVPLASLASALVRPSPSPASPGAASRWKVIASQLALVLVIAQIAAGALLRHQQIDLVWHLLIGGLASVALLTPAVAVLQDPAVSIQERRSARWAVGTVVVQVGLGVTVLLMILVGPPSVAAWLAATIAHVTVGTITLLAAARFAFVLTRGPRPI